MAFVYVTPRGTQAWHTATYSPWLFAGTFAQPLFYSTLFAIGVMWRDSTTRSRVLVGVGLGLTLLTHTAPALLLVVILVCEVLARSRRAGTLLPELRRAVPEGAIVAATSLLVAAPLLLPLIVRYKLRVQNWYPIEWSYELLDLHRAADLAYTHATPATFLAIVGVWRFLSRSSGSSESRPLTFWAIANVLLLLAGYLRQVNPDVASLLPSVVPQFHFLSYFRALIAAFAGHGLLALAEWLQRAMRRLPIAGGRIPSARTVGFGLLAIASVAAMPRFAKRDDFGRPVTEAMALADQTERVAAYNWVKANLDVDAVVLAPDDLAHTVVGAAGRRVVVVAPYFSNPYVSHEARFEAREEMYRLLRESDHVRFCDLAKEYDVSWIAGHPIDLPALATLAWVRPLFSSEDIVIARVECSLPAGAAWP